MKLFVSYCHEDEEWLDKLEMYLRPIIRDGELEVWSDRKIQASSDWHSAIQSEISDADAAILLISQSFLASDYVYTQELPRLLAAAAQRGLRIFQVFVSSCYPGGSWPLSRFQAAIRPNVPLDLLEKPQQNAALAKFAKDIQLLLQASGGEPPIEWIGQFRNQFVAVEGGTVILGDNDIHDQQHALREHSETVDSFRLSRYVITQSDWYMIMHTQPWSFSTDANVRHGSKIPAIYVSWHDAMEFVRRIRKLDPGTSYRLPTEDEWEYAARGGQLVSGQRRTKFSFGDDPARLMQFGWYEDNAEGDQSYAHPVGELDPNPLGLYDMHGNIWEWTATIDESGFRIVRGGGFNFAAIGSASAFRLPQKVELRGKALGFRLAQDAN